MRVRGINAKQRKRLVEEKRRRNRTRHDPLTRLGR
jgi:hypothetical protein